MGIQETLREILDTVAFETDAEGNGVSILAKAKDDLETFLTEHTSISDDEKAKRISDFFTNTITSVTVQAIVVAGQTPLQDAQIEQIKQETENSTNESIQKIISMKNEDDFRDVQKQSLIDETAQKISSMQIDDTNKTNESVQKITSMQNDDKAKLNNSAVNVAKAKVEIETLIPAQVQEISKNIEIKSKDIEIKDKQLLQEDSRLDLIDKDVLLKDKQIDIETAKVPLYEAQADSERAKIGLTSQQIRVSAAEVQYKLAQLKAIQKAGELNKEIEDNKNLTNIKIAKIYKA